MEGMQEFHWQRYPKAEALLEKALDDAIVLNPELNQLSQDLLDKTSSRLFDWVDYISLSPAYEEAFINEGYEEVHTTQHYRVLYHPGAQFPKVVIEENAEKVSGVAVTVDSIEDFFLARGEKGHPEGSYLATFRRALVSKSQGVNFWVVERREGTHIEPEVLSDHAVLKRLQALSMWALRNRNFEDENEAFSQAFEVAEKMVSLVGEGLSAWLVLEVERKYWQMKNRAGQVQKARQDSLGMGWSNHDHHTFRSSRVHFQALVRLFEVLGFRPRERFYAGEEAGWGAQVMEHPHTRLVLFLDVDLSPEEVQIDFAHETLPLRDSLGTIGLWCALHGDSILSAGMHHLELQFQFDYLKAALKEDDIEMMDPFSDFSYLKQAFTKGEMWPVDPSRLEKLYKAHLITEEQKKRFLEKGALGSHMENLQRREGYKGFNQKNVSSIIKKTDPRR